MIPVDAVAPPHDLWPVAVEEVIDAHRSHLLYEIYLESFGPLRALAAARHVLTHAEFDDEMRDPRIRKCTVWRTADEPVALATITNQLAAVPWISPDFWVARYPTHAAREAIYYLGLALVVPEPGQFRVFERLVRALVADCVVDRGVLAYDVCQYNDTRVNFGRRTVSILNRIAPVKVELADVQLYYEAVFE